MSAYDTEGQCFFGDVRWRAQYKLQFEVRFRPEDKDPHNVPWTIFDLAYLSLLQQRKWTMDLVYINGLHHRICQRQIAEPNGVQHIELNEHRWSFLQTMNAIETSWPSARYECRFDMEHPCHLGVRHAYLPRP